MYKVLIADKLSNEALAIFKENGIEAITKTDLDAKSLIKELQDCDGLVVRSATKATKEVIESCKKLKVIGRAGIGVDNVDLDAATSNGKVVMNTPFGNSITTAEHAITLILSTARQIPYADKTTHEGKWEKSTIKGVEVTGKTLGIIGCGNIGTIVAQRALGLHFKVIVFDPFLQDKRAAELGVEKVNLDDLFKRSDFITLHTPLNEKTKNIVSKEAFKKMKKGVRVVGTAANVNSAPLTQTIIYSLLKPTTDSINVINSVLVAKSKSISISEVKHQKENDYQSLIKLTVTTDKQTRSVSGTIFGGRARIVEVKGIKIEADLSEHNLYVTNQDKPGFIKDLSKILADNKINIATFHLGRLSSGGEAIAIISTDNKIENSVIESIKKIPLVIQAKYIQFKDKENE
jgi:phosphoglycerate dehydrogenase-like enzyme